MKKTGADIFVESLRHEGVKTVFGLPGGVVLKIFDVLCQQKDIELVLTRHEQGAAHMAEGYCQGNWQAGGRARHFGTRNDQYRHRFGRCLHGFGSVGCFHGASVDKLDW